MATGKKVVLLILGFAFLTILGSVLWFFPQRQANDVIVYTDKETNKERAERFEIENKARGTLIQAIAGLGGAFFFITAYVALKQLKVAEDNRRIAEENKQINKQIAENNQRLTQDKQVSERFTKAVEMLAHDRLEVRLGGIYALGMVARDSERKSDHWTVMEVLTSFIQEKRPLKSEKPIPKDIQAALTVIGLRDASKDPEEKELFLDETNLSGADLIKTNFAKAKLFKANLSDASLHVVILNGANLCNANLVKAGLVRGHLVKALLVEADLSRADLSGADLSGADLSEAKLIQADLSGARLIEANLIGADLTGANLIGADLKAKLFRAVLFQADLTGANLSGADLTGANLTEADLTEADLSGADLLQTKFEGANLQWANLRECFHPPLAQIQVDNNFETAIYDLDIADQLGLDKDDQIRRAKEWDEAKAKKTTKPDQP
jgi:uncharacterized protein YjbI with pentapeptide repeats